MNSTNQTRAILLLEDGTVFHGTSIGKKGQAIGEICFTTGMTGYQEVFTDPSFFGQLLVTTNAHIGNYGIKDEETESDGIKISGLICKNFNDGYSRPQANSSLQEYFEKEKLVGISAVDTREIVRHIRNKGAMNAIISSDEMDIAKLKAILNEAPSMEGLELASKVSTNESYLLGAEDAKYKVAVLDFGVKRNILNHLIKRDCQLKVFPAKTPFDDIKKWQPDAYFLSNGPGDPAAMDYAINTVKEILVTNQPVFGICLGHQVLAKATGLLTYKMHHGHRGINHPVKNLITGKSEITTQNHGFGLHPDSIKDNLDVVEITHRNLNDDTIEGINIIGKPAFSVQYHPEASPGPHDSEYLFDEFIEKIKK